MIKANRLMALPIYQRADLFMGLIFLISLSLILVALGYQHFGGLAPCDLCYKQRWVYYITIALMPFALFLYDQGHKDAARYMLFVFAAAFFANMILGIFHAGVEWKFWDGPSGCSDLGQLDATIDLLESLSKEKVVPCTDPQWRLLGISMAGYSALASLFLGGLALFASQLFSQKPQSPA